MRSYFARVLFASIAFILMHAGAIPLMSAYGLQVCPVLSGLGFWEGCHYLTTVFALTLVYSAFILWLTPQLSALKGAVGYCFASLFASITAGMFFNLDKLMLTSKAPEIVALITFLLTILLAYLLRWIGVEKNGGKFGFKTGWWHNVITGLAPAIALAIFNTHYIFRLTVFEAEETFFTLLSVTGWMLIVYYVHFMTEHRRASIFSWGLESIKEGDYDYRVPNFIGGVWAPLGRLLNETIVALLERGRLLTGMSRYISRDIAEKVRRGNLDTAAITANLTVLMMDLRDFTAISKSLSSEQLVQFLNIYFEKILPIFIRHNVVVDRVAGDEILAYVESATPGTDEAFSAAMEILKDLPRINIILKEASLPPLHVGIAITQGEVSSGSIGVGSKTAAHASELVKLARLTEGPLVIDKPTWTTLKSSHQAKFKTIDGIIYFIGSGDSAS